MIDFIRGATLSCALWSTLLLAQGTNPGARAEATQVPVEGMTLSAPAGWTQNQNALDSGTIILGYAKGNEYFTLYVKNSVGLDFKSIFVNDSKLANFGSEAHAGFDWKVAETSKVDANDSSITTYVKAFLVEFEGKSYYGYARANTAAAANADANAFLDGLKKSHTYGSYSLTGEGYKGKKYYFGWGAVMDGDPELMQNEVLYDVNHTYDIFTKNIGGNYLGFTLFEHDANGDSIPAEWQKLQNEMNPEDMYIQYSSGHGNDSELAVGVTYDQIRDAILAMPGKELIVFTMACESGGLVDSFNNRRSDWSNYQADGRTLMVMSSSATSELSQTGPETDPEEPNGPVGSPGSAFGYSLWKALIGHADGFSDGVKDGYISLKEIQDYTKYETLQVTENQQTPQWTGSFNGGLIMNRVPTKAQLAAMGIRSENLSLSEIKQRISQLDHTLRIH